MKFGFDIDGVVSKSVEKVLDILGGIYNRKWICNDITCYSFEKMCFVKDEKLNKKIARDFIRLINDPSVHGVFEPYKNVIKYFKKYKKEGHSLHFVSARPTEESNTIKWFKKWEIPFDSIHHTKNKGSVVKSLKLNCFVEDDFNQLEKIMQYNKRNKKISYFLLDKPYNNAYCNDSAVRVYNWEELDRYLGGIKWVRK